MEGKKSEIAKLQISCSKMFATTIRAIQFDFDRACDWKSSCDLDAE